MRVILLTLPGSDPLFQDLRDVLRSCDPCLPQLFSGGSFENGQRGGREV